MAPPKRPVLIVGFYKHSVANQGQQRQQVDQAPDVESLVTAELGLHKAKTHGSDGHTTQKADVDVNLIEATIEIEKYRFTNTHHQGQKHQP